MSAFDTMATMGLTALGGVHSRTVSYTPTGGSAAEVTVLALSVGEPTDRSDPDGEAAQRSGFCLVAASEIAAPARLDELAADGTGWVVVGVSSPGDSLWRLDLLASEAQTKGRSGRLMRR